MQPQYHERGERQYHNVQRVETAECRLADRFLALDEFLQLGRNLGEATGQIGSRFLDGLESHLGGVHRDLVPRQEVAGESESKRDDEQQHARNPNGFAGTLKRLHRECCDEMDEHAEDHGRRRPRVQVAHECAAADVARDVFDGCVGIGDGRLVVEQEHQPGAELDGEEQQREPTEVVRPTHLVDGHFLLLDHVFEVELVHRDAFGQPLPERLCSILRAHQAISPSCLAI